MFWLQPFRPRAVKLSKWTLRRHQTVAVPCGVELNCTVHFGCEQSLFISSRRANRHICQPKSSLGPSSEQFLLWLLLWLMPGLMLRAMESMEEQESVQLPACVCTAAGSDADMKAGFVCSVVFVWAWAVIIQSMSVTMTMSMRVFIIHWWGQLEWMWCVMLDHILTDIHTWHTTYYVLILSTTY